VVSGQRITRYALLAVVGRRMLVKARIPNPERRASWGDGGAVRGAARDDGDCLGEAGGMKTADRLQAIAQYGRRLTRADVALLIRAAGELRNLEFMARKSHEDLMSSYSQSVDDRVRLTFVRDALQAALEELDA